MKEKISLACIGFDFEQKILEEATKNLAFLELKFFPYQSLQTKEGREEVFNFLAKQAQGLLFRDLFQDANLEKIQQELKALAKSLILIPIGPEALGLGLANLVPKQVGEINAYFAYGGKINLTNGFLYLAQRIFRCPDTPSYQEPIPLAFDGIFYPGNPKIFFSFSQYIHWYQQAKPELSGPWVGLLTHRSHWLQDNLAVENSLIRELEKRNIRVLPVFTNGCADEDLGAKDFSELLAEFFSNQGQLMIEGLISLLVFALARKKGAEDALAQAVEILSKANLPVFKPVLSYSQSKEQWENNQQGLLSELAWSYTVPESQGFLEPVLIACRGKAGKMEPIAERVGHFAGRVEKWLRLRNLPENQKKLAIFLHNCPCSGVEASIGMAAGMDALESVVGILKLLQQEGWDLKDFPQTGEELLALIERKKAYGDFRWTTVEDIVRQGGCLYSLSLQEYSEYYQGLPAECQKRLEEVWGQPPGEGLVLGNKLVVTGLSFGNILVMVEPKRGCYGAKCTGEVCKILQDPDCPPPHQYLATYHYLETIWQANAVLHIGAHGSLEFLPGKSNALSELCYSDLVLGSLPNLYLYTAAVPTEAIIAKRRSYALILDHLPETHDQWGREYLHVYGRNLGEEESRLYLEETLLGEGKSPADTKEREAMLELLAKGQRETQYLLKALKGGYLPAGLGGLIRDKGREMLPSGRNLCLLDIGQIPTPLAWQRGCEMGEQLLQRYLAEEGVYPEKIAMNMISTDISGASGEQLSQFFFLLGVKPVWDTRGKLVDLAVIPLEDLGRPRIDVTMRVSGILRDCYPGILELMDEAVTLVAFLAESPEKNYVLKQTRKIVEQLRELGEAEELERRATLRIFGDRPGNYGAGVDLALKASAWQTEDDLAKVFLHFSSFAYGKGWQGKAAVQEFAANAAQVQVTYNTSINPHYDLLCSDFGAAVQGGFRLVKKMLAKEEVKLYHGSSENKEALQLETVGEKIKACLEAKMFNPLWRESLKEKGYRGGAELLNRMQNIFQWQCVTGAIEHRDLDRLAQEYVNDPEMSSWLEQHNPYALEEIARRLLEAAQRGVWQADSQVLADLKKNYLTIEGTMEDLAGESQGERQGGAIEIVVEKDVAFWQEKTQGIEEVLNKLQERK